LCFLGFCHAAPYFSKLLFWKFSLASKTGSQGHNLCQKKVPVLLTVRLKVKKYETGCKGNERFEE
jgi:hypothetical protein